MATVTSGVGYGLYIVAKAYDHRLLSTDLRLLRLS